MKKLSQQEICDHLRAEHEYINKIVDDNRVLNDTALYAFLQNAATNLWMASIHIDELDETREP